jgi:hypothetical protein
MENCFGESGLNPLGLKRSTFNVQRSRFRGSKVDGLIFLTKWNQWYKKNRGAINPEHRTLNPLTQTVPMSNFRVKPKR